MAFSCLSGGNKLKKSLEAAEKEVASLKEKLDERNRQLKALEEKHVDEGNVEAEEIKILEEKNSECTAKIEELTLRNSELEAANKVFAEEKQELTAQISELNILCSDYKDQVESHKEMQTQSRSAKGISCETTMAATSDKEIQHKIESLERKNEELEAALAYEKKKTQNRKREASIRRARFKERVQNLTRKLSDDDSSVASDDAPTT